MAQNLGCQKTEKIQDGVKLWVSTTVLNGDYYSHYFVSSKDCKSGRHEVCVWWQETLGCISVSAAKH